MAFTDKITPSIYQINQIVTRSNLENLISNGQGNKVLTDAGTYIYNEEPSSLKWFLRNTPPVGYLLLGGQTLNRYSYTDLFEAMTVSKDITLSITASKLYFAVIDTTYLIDNLPITLETSVTFPAGTLKSNQLYYIKNINTTNKTFQISTDTTTDNIVNLADISNITGNKKIRIYPLKNYGDYSTTFTILDARGWFLRVKDDSRELGSFQQDAFQGHWHLNAPTIYSLTGNGDIADVGTLARQILTNTGGTFAVQNESYGTPRVSNETRGKNFAANLFLKY